MPTPQYPSTLPGVSRWRLSPLPQALASEGDAGPRSVRRRSRDPGATGSAAWTFVESDFATFKAWYETDLLNGHRRFYITLPSAGGFTWHVARFVAPYRSTVAGHSAFEVSAELEVVARRFSAYTLPA